MSLRLSQIMKSLVAQASRLCGIRDEAASLSEGNF